MDDTALATEIDDETTTPDEPLDVHDVPGTSCTSADGERLDDELLVDELLVEEISIDGMCGVY